MNAGSRAVELYSSAAPSCKKENATKTLAAFSLNVDSEKRII
jgi:hypothetical protein